MITKRGWVVVTTSKDHIYALPLYVLFGPGKVEDGSVLSNITSNRLTFFASHAESRRALKALEKRTSVICRGVATISLEIAETENELLELKKSSDLVIVAYPGNSSILLGPATEGALNYNAIGACEIQHNHFKSFTDYKSALYVALEFRRQAQSETTLAIFSMHFVPL